MKPNQISEEDATQLVTLVANTALPINQEKLSELDDHNAKKRRLLDELSVMLKVDKWTWSLSTFGETGARHIGGLQSGFSLEQATKLQESAHHIDSMRLFQPSYTRIREEHAPLVVNLEEVPGVEQWRESEGGKLLTAADIGTDLICVYPISKDSASVITLYRTVGSPAFTERERQMALIVIRGVGWLHTQGWPETHGVKRVSELPASHAIVLTLLVKGYSRQDIADSRGLSIHSVNTYARNIYSHFEVTSQAELMQYFLHGDG